MNGGFFGTLVVACISCLISVGGADPGEAILLWPDDPKLNAPEGMGKKVIKREKEMIMGVKSPYLKTFPAPKSEDPVPAIIHVPGGSYKRVVTGVHLPIAEWLVEQGIRPFMLVYRCPAGKTDVEPLQDIQRAIRIVRSNAKKWNIDPKRIGVIGSSAGGNLCVRASLFSQENSYQANKPLDRLSARPDFSILLYPAFLASRETGEVNPWVKVPKTAPPTMLIAARDDQHFGSSPAFEKSLKAAGVPVNSLYFKEGGHGFTLRKPDVVSQWPEKCRAWLKEIEILP